MKKQKKITILTDYIGETTFLLLSIVCMSFWFSNASVLEKMIVAGFGIFFGNVYTYFVMTRREE